MAKQERVQIQREHHSSKKREDVVQESPEKQSDSEGIKAEMDDILDEIDLVLEQNAEAFVASYVQKGGQFHGGFRPHGDHRVGTWKIFAPIYALMWV